MRRLPILLSVLLALVLTALPMTSSVCLLECEEAAVAAMGACHHAAAADRDGSGMPRHAPATCGHDHQPVRAISAARQSLDVPQASRAWLGLPATHAPRLVVPDGARATAIFSTSTSGSPPGGIRPRPLRI